MGKKAEPRWVWHAIDPDSGTVLAYGFGRRQAAVFLALQALLEPCGMTRFSTDGWGAYARHIDPVQPHVGKENTQRNREPVPPLAGPDQAARPAHHVLFQNDDDARSGARSLHQSL